MRKTIAIDGSAASGKSTLGSALAEKLNYLYLDTGVMYRSITWATLNAKIDVTDEAAVSDLAETFKLELLPPSAEGSHQATVLVGDQDVTRLIRRPEIDANVAQVSSYSRVRQAMTARQRNIAAMGPVVMVGRDIGTVVLPNADLKIFVSASLEVRARRRYEECLKRGEMVAFENVLAAMAERDRQDREKPISPMVPAQDAVIINTDEMTSEEVLQKVEDLVMARCVV
jgi:cytidylate kinase